MKFEELYKDCHAAGGMSRYAYEDDPKRLAFTAARYKHTAKLLEGFDRVLEIGCSDGYYSRIVRQHVGSLTAIDVDRASIEEAWRGSSTLWPIDFLCGNLTLLANREFDACYALDVLEHVPPEDEWVFLSELAFRAPVLVIGTPSLESQVHASRLSRAGHVNCKSGADLRATLRGHYRQVFMFSMHDEAIGTGFLPMAQYLLALCVK